MLRKNIVQTLDAATSWKVFGLDLDKHDLAVVVIPADGSDGVRARQRRQPFCFKATSARSHAKDGERRIG